MKESSAMTESRIAAVVSPPTAADHVVDTPVGALRASALDGWPADDAAAAMTKSFEDYVVPMAIDGAGFEQRFGPEHVDRFLSRIYFDGDQLVGISLVCRRGRAARLGAFGIVPAHRGRGVARTLMHDLVRRVAAAGSERLLLEVVSTNAAAVRLYETLGFESVRRLVGYRWDAPTGTGAGPGSGAGTGPAGDVDEVDPVRVARVLGNAGLVDPPWQLAPETVAAAVAPRRAFAVDDCAFALVKTSAEAVVLSTLVVRPEVRRRGYGTRLIGGLRARFAGRTWSVPPVVPDGVAAPFFAATGWVPHDLEQIEMSCDLTR